MSYHFFSDPEFAGPGSRDLIRFWDRKPRQLRHMPRQNLPQFRFPNSQILGYVEKACFSDANEISVFWNNYYTGNDWKFRCTSKDIENWMNEGFILIMRDMSDNTSMIIATFVCHILKKGVFCGTQIPIAGLLDGLVVHPKLRGCGLASYMLCAMDKEVYRIPEMKQAILLWFREHDSAFYSAIQTPIAVFEYMYIKISDIPLRSSKANVADAQIVDKIVNLVFLNSAKKFTLSARNSFHKNIHWFTVNSTLIGIADTHRISNNGFVIWEVIFASNFEEPYFVNLQESIEIASLNLPCDKGVVFASNCKTRGNLSYLNKPWCIGTSGFLSVHVYNWMPPTFINGDILFPYSCI